MRLLIYTPKADEPAPAFLGLNFQGNHSVDPDPTISLSDRWVRPGEHVKDNRATEAARGVAARRWPIEMIIDRGYSLVTIYYGDIDPDFDDGFKNGIHRHFAAQTAAIPPAEKWGSIAAWAYGLSRALDYLQTGSADGRSARRRDRTFPAGQNFAVGRRVGPAFQTGDQQRFRLRRGGVKPTRDWRNDRSHQHVVSALVLRQLCQVQRARGPCPVDQHELISLIAPRAVYVASATDDKWADPKGEFLSAVHADPVYRLLGTDGMGGSAPPEEMPAPDQPIKSGTIGYHLRTGKHDVTSYDWQQYLDFADRHLK